MDRPRIGNLQGNYEAATFLVAPKKQQVVSIGGIYDLNASTRISSELAASNYDVNTISKLDKNDNKGVAGKFAFSKLFTWNSPKGKMLNLQSNAGYEFTGKRFKPLERLRSVEFYRDWGLELFTAPATEQLPFITASLFDSAGNSLQMQTIAYLRSDGYKGIRENLYQDQKVMGWQLKNIFSLTRFSSSTLRGYFFRPSVDVSHVFSSVKNYTLGASYAVEHNEIRDRRSDSLSFSSFAFQTFSVYIRSNQAKDNRWSLTYFTRSDQLPGKQKLEPVDRSHNISLTSDLLSNTHHQFRLNTTYRQLTITQLL